MEEKEIHLRDYLRVIAKRRVTVLTFFLITFVTVLIGTMTATPIYIAATKVLIEKSSPEPLMGRYYVDAFDPDFLETQYQLIQSFKVARKVVDILELEKEFDTLFDEPESTNPLVLAVNWLRGGLGNLKRLIVGTKPAVDQEEAGDIAFGGRSPADQIADFISSSLMVSPQGNSRIVNISFESSNPALAARIVNSVARAYREEILEIRMSSTDYAIRWMTQKAEEERKKLEKSEKTLQGYVREKDIVTVEDRIAIIPQQLSEFSIQLTRAETRRKELEAVLDKIDSILARNGDLETIPSVTSNPTINSLRDQIVKAEQHIIELSKKYGEKHPVMIRARSDLAGLQAEKSQEVRRVVESLRNEMALSRSNEENLRNLLARTKDEAITLNEKFIQYGIMKREVESNRLLYDALITKIKEQSVTEQSQNVTVWIVQEADTPKFPAKPRKKMNLLLGLIVGLFGGIGLAFFVEYLDNTVKSPEAVEERFGVTVLGVIQQFPGAGKGLRIERALLDDSMSLFAESYKAIRSSVLLSAAEHPPRTLLVTSAAAKEGKTTTAANLAMAIALADKKVLLIDADLRRPSVAKFFGIDNYKGLSTYLSGISDREIIIEIPGTGLSVIPSGPIPPNPSELLSSQLLQELIDTSREQYDFIIFDSPPVVHVTDSLILSRKVEGTVLVSRFGVTTFELLGHAIDSLRDINSHLIGLVINAVDARKGRYYDYGYYYSYTTYTTEEEEGKG